MTRRVFLLEFYAQDGMFMPKDPELHRLALDYADKQLAKKVNFTDFLNVWVVCQVDENDLPVKATGLLGMVQKVDFPLCRFDDSASVLSLFNRAEAFLHDKGARGHEVFVHISSSETDEQRCPDYKTWLKAFKAEPADRFAIVVK